MNGHRIFPIAFFTLAVLAGCNTLPPRNALLEAARSDYRMAQANPQAQTYAGSELTQAGVALNKADEAWTRHEDPAKVDHLAYLAKQQVAIAQQTAGQKAAEMAVTNANTARDKVRLEARTNEAEAAQRSAASAQLQSEASQRQSEASQLKSEAAQRDSEASQRQSNAAQRQSEASLRLSKASQLESEASQRQSAASRLESEASQRQANDAQARNSQLEAELKDLNAKLTERGMVITIDDVLFDNNKAQLKSGGRHSVEKLVGFLKQFPQRKALIEGFTDSNGSTSSNQDLSGQRADAVRTELVDRGVDRDRIATHGYGEAYPVASNQSAAGRQLNRRVEIILSDDSGNIVPR